MPSLKLKNGVSLNVKILENVVAKDTLFLHGNLASNTWWEPCFSHLCQGSTSSQGSIIAIEWRGCGESRASASDTCFNLETLATDCIDVLETLGRSSVHLVGHSTGALIGLVAMLKRPSLFDKAVLLDSVGAKGVTLSEDIIKSFETMKHDTALCEAVMVSTIHNCDKSSALTQRIVSDAQNVDGRVWTAVPRMLCGVDYSAALGSLEHDVLVLHGEYDTVIPLKDSQELASYLGNGRFQMIEGAGHSFNVEQPRQFAEILKSFLYESK